MEVSTLSEFYDYIDVNRYMGTRAPTGTGASYTYLYFWDMLFTRALSRINIVQMPESWDQDYFKAVLLSHGFIGVCNTPRFGWIPQKATAAGQGLYLKPTELIVAEPLVNFRGTIGTDCSVIHLAPDWSGIMPLVNHYATKLAEIDTSQDMSIKNSRLAFLLAAKNKTAAQTLKTVLQKISSGDPAVIVDSQIREDATSDKEPIMSLAFNPRDSYITDMLTDDFQTILNQFDREIGIVAIDAKKERMISDEAIMLQGDTPCRPTVWQDCLDRSCAELKNISGIDLVIKIREAGAQNE